MKRVACVLAEVVAVGFLAGCVSVSSIPKPQQVRVPQPITGNSGKYMCPFTSDDTVAGWVQMGMKARLGSSIGATAGALAGQEALKQVPFVGGMLGSAVGKQVGRTVAINAAGGWDQIKNSSDLSFNSVDDLAVYMYAKHSSHPEFQKVFKLTADIYPDLTQRYMPAVRNAAVK